jgi:uncharacterized cupredoxin-like copper-binding protein
LGSRTSLVAAWLLLVLQPAFSHETQGSGEEWAFGRLGDPAKVSRTIRVDVDDHLRYKPGEINVRQNETIRFEVKNSGRQVHGIALGTMADLKEHARSARTDPDMQRDEAHILRVAPGTTGALVWQFTQPGEFNYGCLMPGHLEAGMIGRIHVLRK